MNTNDHESGRARRKGSVSHGGSPWLRSAGLLSVIAIGTLILLPPIEAKRTERRVRAMLLAVQEALQRYHVQEELYPKRMMNGQELVKLLVEDKHLAADLRNPWTGAAYAASPEEDWLRYRTDGLAETYELTVLYPGSERVEFRLDSTKHQSLE